MRGSECRRVTGGKTFVACLVNPMIFMIVRHIRLPLHG
ncbi:hypothetical protein RISK_002202 [Rhodopirellula islandica]|uniref:Uncharacterized protein n=1 Tax=Rhodopirellula islandica TaxID=595434 RepID=A0A0J1BG98_RHOIS|nr:hypothetical protein RISK_002202 [Rhodopirellula islandica]